MENEYPTSPFGRRSMTLAMVASQVTARDCQDDRPAHKWKVFRAITECKHALGVSDRALSVLNALLTCMPETGLTPGIGMVVYPSNAQLSLRTHGMTESTLRRHLVALVELQLIVRRDSPNGKRYVRRGQGGDVEHAYGFDLTPLLARAEEFERLAAVARTERAEAALARERITILRRDVGKMIEAGLAFGIKADWSAYQAAFQRLCVRLPRVVTAAIVAPLAERLLALAVQIGKLLEKHAKENVMDGNDVHSDVHYQNSNTDSSTELEPASEKQGLGAGFKQQQPPPTRTGFPLGMILKCCPDIIDYNKHGIDSWRDLIATAGVVRGTMGISPSAWDDAREAMGDIDAAVTIAAMLQRAEHINSPGGYLRQLTVKARAKEFSTGPMIMALMKKRTCAQQMTAS